MANNDKFNKDIPPDAPKKIKRIIVADSLMEELKHLFTKPFKRDGKD
jgi:hypothetical protein